MTSSAPPVATPNRQIVDIDYSIVIHVSRGVPGGVPWSASECPPYSGQVKDVDSAVTSHIPPQTDAERQRDSMGKRPHITRNTQRIGLYRVHDKTPYTVKSRRTGCSSRCQGNSGLTERVAGESCEVRMGESYVTG